MTTSMLLDTVAWDCVLDAQSNWAACTAPYSLAQDVATALRTFEGEVYYNTALGVPYFRTILGKDIPLGMIQLMLVEQALTVSGVVNATCNIILVANRKLTGQVIVTDQNGLSTNVSF
jgi:hypothetical protein